MFLSGIIIKIDKKYLDIQQNILNNVSKISSFKIKSFDSIRNLKVGDYIYIKHQNKTIDDIGLVISLDHET